MPKDKPVELILDLKRHCIETAIRRRYDQTLGAYFKDKKTHAPGSRKTSNFFSKHWKHWIFRLCGERMRPLAGKPMSQVMLSRDRSGRLSIGIDGQLLPDLPTTLKRRSGHLTGCGVICLCSLCYMSSG